MPRPIAMLALPFALTPSALLAQTGDPAPVAEVDAVPPSANAPAPAIRDRRAHDEAIVVTGVRRRTEDVLGGERR